MVKMFLVGMTLLLTSNLTTDWSFNKKSVDSQTVNLSDIKYENGIYYYQKIVYNGNIVAYYQNDKLMFQSEIFDGRLHGMTQAYYPNGILKSERNYYLGKLHGNFIEYYEDGAIKIKGKIGARNYHGGEEVEGLTLGVRKKSRVKMTKPSTGKIIFLNDAGEHYESSESIAVYNQNHFIITNLDESKTLLEVK